jgi:hypothetical protein
MDTLWGYNSADDPGLPGGHRIKQTPGSKVTQPKPGFHEWTTPTGRARTREPKRYPAWRRQPIVRCHNQMA